MAKSPTQKKPNGNSSALGFEATLWATADKLRDNLAGAEHKHVVLGLSAVSPRVNRCSPTHMDKAISGQPAPRAIITAAKHG